MARLKAPELPIAPRRASPTTAFILLRTLWCSDLRLPQCLWAGEEVWTHYQGSSPPPLHLDALPQAPLDVYRGLCGIPPTECFLRKLSRLYDLRSTEPAHDALQSWDLFL